MAWTPLNILIVVLGITLLAIIHEGGHYLAARAFGMRVLRVSIGLGKPIWQYRPKGSPTIFQVSILPFLAYVEIDGMNPTAIVDPDDPQLYPNKSVLARLVTIAAGPFANYLAASLMVFGLALTWGVPEALEIAETEVGTVTHDSPAEAAGIREGDVILAVDGKRVDLRRKVIARTRVRAGQPTEFLIRRDGQEQTVTVTPELREGRGMIGVMLGYQRVWRTHPVGEAVAMAVREPWERTILTIEVLRSRIRERSTEGIQGPWGMGRILVVSAADGPQHYIWTLMMLSIALGFFNLLPLPALDGGRLVFLGYELITRRRANEHIEAVIHALGLIMLLGVLVLVTVRDVLSSVPG